MFRNGCQFKAFLRNIACSRLTETCSNARAQACQVVNLSFEIHKNFQRTDLPGGWVYLWLGLWIRIGKESLLFCLVVLLFASYHGTEWITQHLVA